MTRTDAGPVVCAVQEHTLHSHICFVGLLPWLIHMRVFAGQCCDVRVLHPSSIAATFCLICSMGSARACPGSTCISPVWLERCTYPDMMWWTMYLASHP